jgi:hypothetical protein
MLVSNSLKRSQQFASLAARSFSGRVQIFDSQNVSLGRVPGLGCRQAAGAGLPEAVLDRLERLRPRSIWCHAGHAGVRPAERAGLWARASLGALLDIKPFIEVRREVFSLGETAPAVRASPAEKLIRFGKLGGWVIQQRRGARQPRFCPALPARLSS